MKLIIEAVVLVLILAGPARSQERCSFAVWSYEVRGGGPRHAHVWAVFERGAEGAVGVGVDVGDVVLGGECAQLGGGGSVVVFRLIDGLDVHHPVVLDRGGRLLSGGLLAAHVGNLCEVLRHRAFGLGVLPDLPHRVGVRCRVRLVQVVAARRGQRLGRHVGHRAGNRLGRRLLRGHRLLPLVGPASRDRAELLELTKAALVAVMSTKPENEHGENIPWTFSDGKIVFNMHSGATQNIAELAVDIATATLAELKRREGVNNGN